MKMILLRGLVVAALLALAPPAWASSLYYFTFTQGGYPEDSYVTGNLILMDSDGDGVIQPTPPYGDGIDGFMRLHGHPAYPGLTVPFFAGWFNLSTLTFQVSGDYPLNGTHWMITGVVGTNGGSSAGIFGVPDPGNLPGFVSLTSTAPIVLTRVPDAGPSYALTFFVFAGLLGVHRFRVSRTPSCSEL